MAHASTSHKHRSTGKQLKWVAALAFTAFSCLSAKAGNPTPGEWPMSEPSMAADTTATETRGNLTTQTANKLSISVSNRVLKITGVEDGTKVEIFSLLGNKVHTAYVSNGELTLPPLNKGIYIVRIDKYCQKIVL